MDKLKTLLKNEKEIIEGFFISILTAWGLTSIFRGTYGSISSFGWSFKSKFPNANSSDWLINNYCRNCILQRKIYCKNINVF